MKLALSALLVSAAMTAPLVAQVSADAPPPPPEPGMHHGEPGMRFSGPGMFGARMEAHRAEPIANSPFTAQFTATSTFTSHDGKQEQRTSTSTVSRDSAGRVREEITLPPPPPRPPAASADANTAPQPPAAPRGPRTLVVILDPVAHTITRLNAERKAALVDSVPADFFSRMQKREERREAGKGPHSDHVTRTDLGNKVIGGVSAKGERTTFTLPVRDGETAHTMTHEAWYSPDAKLEVSSSETSDRGSRTDTLTSFSKAEPDASLFQVPAGYTTRTAPEHGFGGARHRGPGGPGSMDTPEPPLPPPSM